MCRPICARPLLKITKLRTETAFLLVAKKETSCQNQQARKNNEASLHSPHWLKQEQPPTLKPTLAHNSTHWPNELPLTGIFHYTPRITWVRNSPAYCLLTQGWPTAQEAVLQVSISFLNSLTNRFMGCVISSCHVPCLICLITLLKLLRET